jgi:4-hydroxythreonine-4-phosphate dehydrogenase
MMKKSRKYNSWNFNRDLNGIKRVVLKTFEDSRMLELCTPVIFANVKIMSFIKNLESAVPLHGIDKLDQIVPGKINVLNLWKEGSI